MIRPTIPADTATLVRLADDTNVFKPHEITALQEVLDDYHEYNHAHHHFSVTYERDGRILGFAYYAEEEMADRVWYLYWIAVSKQTQAKGIGGQLLKYVEDDIRKHKGRILLIETSSLPSYDPTRKFYLKHNYIQEAVLKDYYADGDDLVYFWKRL
jgi:ribosomal protein S18 acetylase RimI-like enzyme